MRCRYGFWVEISISSQEDRCGPLPSLVFTAKTPKPAAVGVASSGLKNMLAARNHIPSELTLFAAGVLSLLLGNEVSVPLLFFFFFERKQLPVLCLFLCSSLPLLS